MTDGIPVYAPCSDNIGLDDINSALRTESKTILREDLQTDDNTTIPESKSIAVKDDLSSSTISDAKWFDEYTKKLLAMSSPIIWDYHKNEIENVNKIINFILILIIVIFALTITLITIFTFLGENAGAIISAITGGFFDGVLGIMSGLFNSTLKSKKSYFDAESESSKFDKMLLLVQTISNKDKKDEVIADIIQCHFKTQK